MKAFKSFYRWFFCLHEIDEIRRLKSKRDFNTELLKFNNELLSIINKF